MKTTTITGGEKSFVYTQEDEKRIRESAAEHPSVRGIHRYYEEHDQKVLETEKRKQFLIKLIVVVTVILAAGIFIALKFY